MKTHANLQIKSKEELMMLISSLEQKLQQRDSFIQELQQALALAKQRHFGRKSEKDTDGAIQSELFDEAVEPDNFDEITVADETIIIPEHQSKKAGRKALPKDLPRVQIIHDLPEEEKICHCGCQLTAIVALLIC